tara:strand:+ start:6739 stop:7461 length:723 start_codon:yes stop_codon:yes gene_type:complete
MKKSSLIQEEAILSFNKKIIFPEPPTGFSVKSVMPPPVSLEKLNSKSQESFEEGKQKAKEFYLEEIKQLKDQLAVKQNELLDQLNQRTEQLLDTLDKNLPNLVMEIVQKILPSIKLSASEIEGNVRALIKEFSDEEEKLEVFLCPEDLKLLKALGKGSSTEEDQEKADNQNEDGFASAIAGIFDNLDGEDSVLPDLPRVSFFEDSTLITGDCQIKSKFGLLDGRIATKIRKIEEELTENG